MPDDARKRQKKHERHAARRKAKQHQLARAKPAGLAERLTLAARYPVLDSWVSTTLWTQGLGSVCLSRVLPNGAVAFAIFLIDRYCLGAKDAMANVMGRATYDSKIARQMRSKFPSEDRSPAAVRKLVEGAVDYAAALGLHPHPDYHKAKPIFGDIDPAECAEVFEYGKDGKPFFISGPHDTPERCRQILKALQQHCGPDGSHYLIPLGEAGDVLPERVKLQPARKIGPDEAGNIIEYDMDFSEEQDQ